jgi:hypothetical protein
VCRCGWDGRASRTHACSHSSPPPAPCGLFNPRSPPPLPRPFPPQRFRESSSRAPRRRPPPPPPRGWQRCRQTQTRTPVRPQVPGRTPPRCSLHLLPTAAHLALPGGPRRQRPGTGLRPPTPRLSLPLPLPAPSPRPCRRSPPWAPPGPAPGPCPRPSMRQQGPPARGAPAPTRASRRGRGGGSRAGWGPAEEAEEHIGTCCAVPCCAGSGQGSSGG